MALCYLAPVAVVWHSYPRKTVLPTECKLAASALDWNKYFKDTRPGKKRKEGTLQARSSCVH
eukprot:1020690-Pelagomonas_calceolata.AAC.1